MLRPINVLDQTAQDVALLPVCALWGWGFQGAPSVPLEVSTVCSMSSKEDISFQPDVLVCGARLGVCGMTTEQRLSPVGLCLEESCSSATNKQRSGTAACVHAMLVGVCLLSLKQLSECPERQMGAAPHT